MISGKNVENTTCTGWWDEIVSALALHCYIQQVMLGYRDDRNFLQKNLFNCTVPETLLYKSKIVILIIS